jgi:hypothetical protein
LVRFRFYKPKTKKTKPNRTEPKQKKQKKPSQTRKPSQTGLNRFLSKKPNRTETSRFEPVSVFLNFFFSLVTFLYKNRTEQKMITSKKYPSTPLFFLPSSQEGLD